jgi:anti-sigma regulatory factor (Ser/Thr protein kinase)
MEDLSLHILDVAENSITAGARNLSIMVREDTRHDLLAIMIEDDGKGMDADTVQKAADPFFTSRTTRRVGLGLALLRQAAEAANGTMHIRSTPGTGTTVSATFQLSHVDRKPLGGMAETIIALIATSAEIDLRYAHTVDGKTVEFDTKEIRAHLGGIPINSVAALGAIRDHLTQEEHTLAQ